MLWFLLATVSCFSLQYRVKKLEESAKSAKGLPIDLDSTLFDMLTESGRNYTLYVLLTTYADEHNCVPCQKYKPEYQLVSEAWDRIREPGKLYFSTLEFKNAVDVFNRLQINSVPILIRYTPDGQNNVDLSKFGLEADGLVEFVNLKDKVKLRVKRPIDWSYWTIVGCCVVVVLGVLRSMSNLLKSVLTDKKLWLIFTLAFVAINCSGFMWNMIRHPPYAGQDGSKIRVFAQGFSQQYAIETQIVAFLYGSISLAFIGLSMVPEFKSSTQKVIFYVSLSLFVGLYSLLLKVFRDKSGGYPFKLLL